MFKYDICYIFEITILLISNTINTNYYFKTSYLRGLFFIEISENQHLAHNSKVNLFPINDKIPLIERDDV